MRKSFLLIICFFIVISGANGWAGPTATIHLKKGFNLVALHAETNLATLFTTLGNSSEIEKLMAYDGQTQEYVILTPEDFSAEGFAVGGGQGLIVYAATEKDVTFDFAVCPSMEFEPGFNLVGLACRGESYTAFQLLNELGSENVSSVQRFSVEKGFFETAAFLPDEQLVGIDFPIIPGEGYFLYMRQATSPLDSDGDGLLDSEESQYGTFPDNPDSDGDGLLDGLEVNVYGTNPLEVDTDEDGYDDGLEVAWGSNPLDNASTPTPPDPAEVAPELDQTVATNMLAATEFLYTGSNPIQMGMASEVIEPTRVAVLRGKVLDRDMNPLPGVTITVLNHPDYGQTLSRVDGMFDLTVNGGEPLTVTYEKEGYLSAQRQMEVPWQDYVFLPDVAMIQVDPEVTTIDLDSATPFQVAQGSQVTDTDGTRQATLLFPQGTTAEILLPDGSTQPVTSLNVHVTEYTVGPNGPQAMPAELPKNVAYTYAVELTAEEAVMKVNGKDVLLSQPVYFYVENFLGFPTGIPVPVGYYDNDKGCWVPSEDGRVIEILSINGGLADLDVDGDGSVDTGTVLSDMGITDSEREKLAGLYQPGQTLSRVPVRHFSTYDPNYPVDPPPDAEEPEMEPPEETEEEDKPCKDCFASTINCQTQTLGEDLVISGTPFVLHYQSDRAPGHKEAYTLDIPVSGATISPSLKRIDLTVRVAGQVFEENFGPQTNLTHSFTWDGQDAYGRVVQGSQPVHVRIGYVYDGTYQMPPPLERSFGSTSGVPMPNVPARSEITLWQDWLGSIGTWDARAQGLGGWTLNSHHSYDPTGRIVYFGDGQRRSAQVQGQIITTVAGNGTWGYSGDGGPAIEAQFDDPAGLAVGPDGSIYIADWSNAAIRRVDPNGIITTVAGNGTFGYSGDGGPATAAQLAGTEGVAIGPCGGLYISDSENSRIRRVGPDGIITTVAGTGDYGISGDGGPAIEAELMIPGGIAVGPDCSLYIADEMYPSVRRVDCDGIITTFAGNGTWGFSGDGGPATTAQLAFPYALAVGPDGSLYIGDGPRIRRVGPDGIITTVAGTGLSTGFNGDGGPAIEAELDNPTGLAVGPDGSLYIVDDLAARIRRVGPNGIITTVAGNGTWGFSGDGGPATAAQFDEPFGVAMGPDGSSYISDSGNERIRRMGPTLPGFSPGEQLVPAEDGSEVYVFDGVGRHLRTLVATTGEVVHTFIYDSKGFLARIEDGDGNVTSIERLADGSPTAIISPCGLRTSLDVDAEGHLNSITNPADEIYSFAYTTEGQLERTTNPNGHTSLFTYDARGRLTRDQDPAGGFQDLGRTELANGYEVTRTTALGRVTVYRVEGLSTGDQQLLNTFPDGTKSESLKGTDGSIMTTYPDGRVVHSVKGPDPRLGMQLPIVQSQTVTTPNGLSRIQTTSRMVTLTDPDDPLSLISQTQTTTVNGRISSAFFDAIQRQITYTTAEGRQRFVTIDSQGRITEQFVPSLTPIQFVYDSLGRLISATQGSRSHSFEYDNGCPRLHPVSGLLATHR